MNKKQLMKIIFVLGSSLFSMAIYAAQASHYTKPIENTASSFDIDRSYAISSKEYWFEITGAALNKGVPINNTSPQVLMLISQARDGSANHSTHADFGKLDVSLMQLVSEHGKIVESKGVAESQLAQTGFFSKSTALFTDKAAQDNGPLTLKSTQPLNPTDKFLVMIREPQSDYVLQLATENPNIDHQRKYLASASVSLPRTLRTSMRLLRPVSFKAVLVGVDGSKVKLKSEYKDGKFYFLRPQLSNIIAPINGLYELLIEANGYHNGNVFNRKAKLALALSQPTANIADTVMEPNDIETAQVHVLVDEFSRFEVRAILYATNPTGKFVAAAESHVALELNAGMAILPLNFDPSMVAKANLKAPYKIDNIRLYDQHQMALLQEQNSLQSQKPIIDPKYKWR
ncbi:DUF4785 domain-containing protein [Aliiglaciecola litoralis]|uniref:DUF4785 family protein n=1 Tax=Aliiglaciecola litoralis TaxID=582857 RepID=A0ABN1LEB3_9ALTE